jgi:hypothetical protein
MSSGLLLALLVIFDGGFFGAMFRGVRTFLSRCHIIFVWVLAGLMMGHIASVYYF